MTLRLVAFDDNDHPVVDHLDRDTLNNHFLNLRWTEWMQEINQHQVITQLSIKGVNFNLKARNWNATWSDNEGTHTCKTFSVRKHWLLRRTSETTSF